MRTYYSRTLRVISAVTLAFFSWTFLSLWEIPAAIAAEKQKAAASGQASGRAVSREQRPEERFEGVLESIREQVGKAEEKTAKGEDDSAERLTIKAKKTELEAIDLELKKEFDATGQRLKAAKMPKEIMTRHAAFVEYYTDNINSLNKELDDIDTAKTVSARKVKIKKAKEHLARVKPATRHQKIDPNNLPFRARKAGKTVAPRLKKEEFEKDFPQQKSQGKRNIPDSRLMPDLLASRQQPKPVLLAFNETASDIPLSLGAQSSTPRFALSDSSSYLLAQATVQPSADDLAETPDVQFTPAIRAKAQELGGKPLKIYEWVRNNIEYAPTYGSIQGADQCLQSRICNDMDTASLLIALLRVSGVYSHYEYSTIEIPIEQAMNWVGGVTDPKMAGTILATNGIPAKMLVSGGTYKAVQLEHVYVSAFIDYIPSRGAVHKQGDTWIPLDPSYKQYTYTQGIDIGSAVPFDAQTFANQILSTATTNTTDSSVTNVDAAFVQQTMQDYKTQAQNYIQQNHPNATVGDVIGKKEIIPQTYPILLGTLPFKTVQIGSEFTAVPGTLRVTMSFNIPDPTGASTGLTYTTGMPQIAGKKITLSFSPATANDQAVIESLLPAPHADGTPIQQSELPSSFHAYLINLKPELRIDGQVVATGSFGTMGSEQYFTMSLNEPGLGISNIENIIKTGEYFGIAVDTGRISAAQRNVLKTKLEATKVKLEAQIYDGLSKDNLVGDLLYTTITAYFAELDVTDELAARTMNVIRYRAPSVGMFSLALNIKDTFGMPTSAGPKGMIIDVDRIMQSVFSKDGNMDKVKQYMLSSGGNSSALEHAVPEQLFSTPTNPVQGISAVKTLNAANDQGIPIYMIDQTNVNTILPLLQLNGDVKNDIQNAVNAGKIVNVQKTNVTYNGWTGCGFIIIDPNTGAGAYMISDGLNGGGFMYMFWTVMWVLAWVALITALTILAAVAIAFILPVIISALGAIAGAVGGMAIFLGELALDVSITASVLVESNLVSSAIFSAFMFYAQNSPPPSPIPTDLQGGVIVYLLFRVFLYLGIKDFIKSGYLTLYWKLAANTEIMLREHYVSYLKPLCPVSCATVKAEKDLTRCFT